MEEQKNVETMAQPQQSETAPVKRTIPQIIFGSATWACILSFLLITIGQLIGAAGYFALGSQSSDLGQTAGMYLIFSGCWLMFLLNALLRPNRPLLKAYGTGLTGNRVPQLLIGLLIGLAMNGMLIVLAALNGDIHVYFDKIEFFPVLLLFVSVFIQSSAEEVACRGFVYYRVLRTYKEKYIVAVLVNAVFFGALHLGNSGVTALAFFDIVVTGVLFSAMVYYFDSLWMAMGAHAGWNFMQSILVGLPNSGTVFPYSVFKLDAATARDSFFYNVGFGVEGTIPAILIQIVALVAIIMIGRKKNIQRTDIWA